MRRLLFLCPILLFMGLVSCHRDVVSNSKLLRAETLMDTCADSSYHILSTLPYKIFTKADRIRYGLLLAEALNKTSRPLLSCDSLLDDAIRYYPDGVLLAKALMYKERIQAQMNMPKEAMTNCFSALKALSGSTNEELRIRGMVYEDLGHLYSDQYIVDKSMNMFRKAEVCYKKANFKRGMSSIEGNIGWNFLLEGDTLQARKYLKRGLTLAAEEKNYSFMTAFYHNLSCAYTDKDSILYYGKRSLSYDSTCFLKAAISVGYAFMNTQRLDSAEFYIRKALKGKAIETRALAYYGLKDVMEERQDYPKAFEYVVKYSNLMDSIYLYNQSSEVEQRAYKYEADLGVYKAKMEMKFFLFIIIASSLLGIVLSMFIVQRVKRRKKILQLEYERDRASLNANIAELQYRIASLRREQEQDKEHISSRDQEIRKLADEKAKLCNLLFKRTPIYQRIQELSLQGKTKRKHDMQILLEKEQEQLRVTVSDIYKDYISYLNHTYPKYTEDDCLLSCLSLCGWDDFTIALCFGRTSKQIVVQRRYRLKSKELN